MTQRRFRFMHRHQRGFTLIELLIAIAIAGVITGVITVAVMQILSVNHRASNHMIAVRQVQQAGKEVSKDTLQAQNIIPSEGAGEYPPGTNFPLSLNWTDWGGLVNVVVYNITEDGELRRSHSVNGTPVMTAPAVVAEYIDPDHTSCVWDGSVLVLEVTARVGTESETRTYEVEPRPT